jgi:2,4-dienoyl-CoA reductase-like NADH-dependent reductase (Old Yellow Enzyme family)
MNEDFSKLLSPFQFPVSGIQVDNRIVMAPMTTFSGNEDGTVSDDELSYTKSVTGEPITYHAALT